MSDLHRLRIDLDPLSFSSANTRRTPGLHLTDVLRDMAAVAGTGKKHSNKFTESDLAAYQLQGYLWEDVVTEQLVERIYKQDSGAYWRPPEIAVSIQTEDAFFVSYDDGEGGDGRLLTPIPAGYVLMSPDGVRIVPTPMFFSTWGSPPDDVAFLPENINKIEFIKNLLAASPVLAEFKWTTKSANMDPARDRADWLSQAKSYCLGMTRALGCPVTMVEWHVQFACGTAWGTPPMYELWGQEFGMQQLEEHWISVGNHIEFRMTEDAGWPGNGPGHAWAKWMVS